MSDTNTAPESGSASLDVNSAAAGFLDMMTEPEDSQPESTPEAQEEAQEIELTADDIEDETPQAEDDESADTPEPQTFRVKASGEEVDVTLDELINGYQRGADYTKRSQALAEERKAVQAERTAIEEARSLRDTYMQRLSAMEQLLEQREISDEQLEALKDSDEVGYMRALLERQQSRDKRQQLQAERERTAEKHVREQQQELKAHVAREAESIKQSMPAYFDDARGPEMRKQMWDYALNELGAPEERLNSIYDAWQIQMLWDASQYRKLLKNKQSAVKQTKEAPKMLKSGASGQRANLADEQMKRARGQLKKTGKVSDAAALFEQFL
jgi:hypothetical protein